MKTPTVLQMEAVECGAAALAIVLGYYKLFLPLERVRADCGVSRDGSRAINLVKAARRYGMEAKGLRKEPEDLQDLTMPVILHWNFNHFIVLEGISRGRAYINDPASGRRTILLDELNRSFTGIVLSFQPGKEFIPSGSKSTILEILYPKLRTETKPLLFLVLAGIAMLIPGIALPAATRIFIDDILLANHVSWLYPLLAFMSFFIALEVLISWLREICLMKWETDLSIRLSGNFFYKILFLPLSFFDQRFAGEISSRVALNDQVATILSGKAASTVLDIVVSIVYLALLFMYSWVLTIVACLIAVTNLIFLNRISQKRVDLSRKLLQEQGKLSGVAVSGLQTIESLKASGHESDFFERWAGYHAGFINTERSVGISTSLLTVIPTFINGIGTTAILAIGSYLIITGNMTIGYFFAYQALLINFLFPIQRLVNMGGDLYELEGSLQRLADVERNVIAKDNLTDSEDGCSTDIAISKRKLEGHLEFKEITFGYNPFELPLLDKFSINLKPGRRIALVGPSGCGKSTIARLIAGVYDPWSGKICIDGIPLVDIKKSLRYLSLAFVSQEIFIFEGTIRENIALWDKTIPESDIIEAAKDAEIHNLIISLPGGYEYYLSEGGKNLSGGQRQRLEIARALAGSPSILVLDEATSALDPVTERLIEQNLTCRGCTCLIIAHRLSTIRDCDEIIVLKNGKIVEKGTHQQMLMKKGPYYDLITAEETTVAPFVEAGA